MHYDSYDNIKSQIRSFDLLGFRGGDVISDIITTVEEHEMDVSNFSHVGIVVKSDILPYYTIDGKQCMLDPDAIYVFESTFSYAIPYVTDGVPDVCTNAGMLGVQLRNLDEVIPRYITNNKTKVAWCKLKHNPLDTEDLTLIQTRFMELFESYHGRMYEISPVNLFGSLFPGARKIRKIRNAIMDKIWNLFGFKSTSPSQYQFCSELVGNIYTSFGIIDEKYNPQDMVPVDFLGSDLEGMHAIVYDPIYIRDWKVDKHAAVSYTDDIQLEYKSESRKPLRSKSCSTLYRSKSTLATRSSPKITVEFSTP